MIGTRGSVDNQDKIVSAAEWCGLNIPHPLHCRCKVCPKKLYGGCSAAEESRVCAACGEEVCEDCSCAGAGAGDTPRGDTAADSSFIPTSFRINNGFVLFAQGGKITKIADKL